MTAQKSTDPETGEAQKDTRWDVVARVLASDGFVRSPRLSTFLLYVCELAREGRESEINEQRIGREVFQRRPHYDSGADSIVRSHATRLRQRLDRYFLEEGAREPWRLLLPKGSYAPQLEPHWTAPVDPEEVPCSEPVQEAGEGRAAEPAPAALAPASREQEAAPAAGWRRVRWPALAALLLLTGVACFFAGRWQAQTAQPAASETERIFWSQLFNRQEPTVVAIADSGLVMLQNLSGRRVDLPAYASGRYLDAAKAAAAEHPDWLRFGSRRYTSVVDVEIVARLLSTPGLYTRNTSFEYSRDLQPDNFKHGSAVLLGTYESTPWVQMFEPGMNFYFRNDLATGEFAAINRNPLPGEERQYVSRAGDPQNVVYGLVAYRPSLNGRGHALILEGQSMAGTETASDFVLDDAYLLPFLRSIERPDGMVPSFELLLRSENMRGEASKLEIVARRVE